jgi:subtilisin family serine protease
MTLALHKNALATVLRSVLIVSLLLAGQATWAKKGRGGGDGGGPTPTLTADVAVAGEILVRLRSTAALAPLLAKYQLTLKSQFGARPIYRLGVIGAADPREKIAALLTEVDVLLAEQNFVHRSPEARRSTAWIIGAASTYAAQWAPDALRLPEAHALSTGAGMRVAVLDTGIDASHPAFAGRLLKGFDFVDFDTDPSEVGSAAASPSFGHGTHVAGLVALVAPAARIMPLRVLDADGSGNAWVLGEALLYAVDPDGNPATDDGAHVINMSLGSYERTEILDSLGRLASCSIPAVIVDPIDDYSDPGYNGDKQRCAASRGAVMVAAAGNDGSDRVREYPAAERVYGLLAVTASTAASQLADFGNFGSWVHVAAPGEGITSAIPGGGFGTWSGTSMAAPLAAGTAALLRASEPALSPKEAARRLERVSAALCGTDRFGRLDAAAVLLNKAPPPTACR